MKTTIVQLEAHDDVNSIKDKISWCKSERIILVFPNKARKTLQQLDLNLIKRSSVAQGATLAIVTRDSRLKEIAIAVGLQVFSSIPKAEKTRWIMVRPETREKKIPRGFSSIYEMNSGLAEKNKAKNLSFKLRLLVFLGSLMALAAAAFFIIPIAQVKIYPQIEEQRITLDVTASSDLKSVNISGIIPAIESSILISGEESRQSTGTVMIPQVKAQGIVQISNLTQDDIVLPMGTIVSTSGENPQRFLTLSKVTVLPSSVPISVKVESLQPGSEGNISENQIDRVEGLYGSMLKVTNNEPFEEGISVSMPSPSTLDYNLLRSKLMQRLKDEALAQARSQKTEYEVIVDESLDIKEINTEAKLNPVGEPSDSLTLQMTIEYQILSYSSDDLSMLANQILDASIKNGYHVVGGPPEITTLSEPQFNETGDAFWKIAASRKISKTLDTDELRSLLAGKKIKDAIEILDNKILHKKSAEIIPFMKIWKRMPFLGGQIKFMEFYEE
jgi:hypothetical protein